MTHLFGTIRRSAQLAKMGWTARKIRKTDGQDRLKAQRALAALLADARGIPMKIGQILAGTDTQSPYRKLVSGIKPLPLSELQPSIEESLGRPLHEIFASFEESKAAASLGQVHFATLVDGTEVAVKVRYPDIVDAIEAELKLIGLMPGVGPVKKWGFDLEGYKQNFAQNMKRELDYRSEAQRQAAFGQALAHIEGLRIPKVYTELCTETLIVQEREHGILLEQTGSWSRRDRLIIARTLLQTLLTSAFVYGEVHGDPHSGNAFYRHDESGNPVVVLLDFGCTVPVSKQRRLALLKLLLACREGDALSPLRCFSAIGFDPKKLSYIDNVLPTLSRLILLPFLQKKPFHPKEWELGEQFKGILGEQRWWFRTAGPPDFLLFMRAFQGLIHQIEQLDVRLPWWPFLERLLGEELLQEARDFELPELPEHIVHGLTGLDVIARSLRVTVFDDGAEKISLHMPAEAALDLQEIIPFEIIERIEQSQSADLQEITAKAKDSLLAPQELFFLQEETKQYRVWLE